MHEADLHLSAEASAELARFVHREALGSTQDEAFALGAPARGACVVVADQQSAGRGRRGRVWQSDPEGALAFTVIRAFGLPAAQWASAGLVAAMAVASALRGLGAASVGVKWPNDVVHEGAKLGGLLLESRGEALALGVGLNLALRAGMAIDQPWTDLRAAGATVIDRAAVLGAVLNQLLPALARFEREGFGGFAEDWPHFDVLAGREVRVHGAEQAVEGRALGIAPDGGLRVRHVDGERVHYAGEVSIRVAA